ncbi:MAG: hypothetical protein WBX15_05910 [Thermoanaerobaculia bacterium]
MFEIDRRRFVILGTAATAGLALRSNLFAESWQNPSFVSVGYCSTVRRVRTRRAPGPRFFESATGVPGGDPAFFRDGARFRIHDFCRASAPATPERIDVDVLFPAEGLEQKVSFLAWQSRSNGGSEGTANPLAFRIPVQSTGTTDVVMRRRIGEIDENVTIPFSVNDGAAAIKLNHGIYAIALLREGDSAPRWGSVQAEGVNPAEDRMSIRLVRDSLDGPVPVTFDYLLLSVSYPEND